VRIPGSTPNTAFETQGKPPEESFLTFSVKNLNGRFVGDGFQSLMNSPSMLV